MSNGQDSPVATESKRSLVGLSTFLLNRDMRLHALARAASLTSF